MQHGNFGRVEETIFPGAESVRARGGNEHGRQEDDCGRSE
jgi:hypothetical protein